jgi:hypothetical protein
MLHSKVHFVLFASLKLPYELEKYKTKIKTKPEKMPLDKFSYSKEWHV